MIFLLLLVNLVKLDLDLDPDPVPHSEKLLDPDPHNINADPQPWYTVVSSFFVDTVSQVGLFYFCHFIDHFVHCRSAYLCQALTFVNILLPYCTGTVL